MKKLLLTLTILALLAGQGWAANVTIKDLTDLSAAPAGADSLHIWDVSAVGSEAKEVTITELFTAPTFTTNITVGTSTALADAAGTLTLQAVDALDATTEATIEAAIDTLSNLTSVGTITTGAWNAGAVSVSPLSVTAGLLVATAGVVPDDVAGADIGGASLEWDDAFFSDGSIINFGNDQEVTLTHVADTGLQMELDDKIMFNAVTEFIHSDDAGYVDIDAATGIRLNADVTSTGTVTGASLVASPSATPAVDFDDSGDTGTIEGSINVNCPTLNDCDMDFAVNSGADTETVVFRLDTDTDGNTVFQVGNPGTNYVQVDEAGAMTFAGTGDINLPDDSVDVADLSTDSVTMDAVDADGAFTSLTGAWATTGLLSGGVVTKSTAANYIIGTTNAAESYGGIIYVTSAATVTAPAVGVGMHFTVITIGAIAVSMDVNALDKMVLDGTTLDDGDKATNTSTTGDLIVCSYYSADGWYCASGSNDGDLWTDTGA